ncbi:MAG: 4-vinyl reductase [Anaerolineae bacterium]|nr:4-vinyl reductase [Anaerolineae bacterium]
MVTITDKPEHDPIADYRIADAYMRWAMEAVKKVIGPDGLTFILQKAGLERFIENPPSGEMIVTNVTFGEYASFSAALVNHFQHPGKNMVKRVGRESAQMAVAFQRTLFNMATVIAAKTLPSSVQVKMGLSAMLAGFKTLYEEKAGQMFDGRIEERDEHYAVIFSTCPFCAGKQSESCIGWLWEAVIEEAARQAWGKFFDVVEVECRARGDAAGVWLVPKQPSDENVNISAR